MQINFILDTNSQIELMNFRAKNKFHLPIGNLLPN